MLKPTGFWSYSSLDDEHSRGRLSQLRALLTPELQQKVGRSQKVNIFQDVAAIPPGQEWERQIRSALNSSFFLIPIITPGMLQSEWCCREINLFREREATLGRAELIFPFHYLSVEYLDPTQSEDCHDQEVFAFLRSRQWIDFRSLRLKSPDSEEVALKLEAMADAICQALRRTEVGAPTAARDKTVPQSTLRKEIEKLGNQHDYDRTIADCSEAIRLYPQDARSYCDRGLAWWRKGDYDRAIADFDEAIRLDPELALAYDSRGLAWVRKGDYDRAIADYDEAIRLNPKYALFYHHRGTACWRKGDYDRALVDHDEAIRVDPKYSLLYHGRGAAWLQKGDYDHAITDFDEAIRLDPKYADAYYNRGGAWWRKGDYDRAIADYDEAIRLNPNDADPYHGRGLAWVRKGDDDRAIADFDEAIRLDPKYADAYYNRGSARWRKGDYDRAIADHVVASLGGERATPAAQSPTLMRPSGSILSTPLRTTIAVA